MVRGGGRGYSSRGNSYRGSGRGSPWNGGGFGRSPRGDRYSFDAGYDKRTFSDRYPRDDYAPKPYNRMENYSRERHSPERKRPRTEGPSRHEFGRYDSYASERRGYSSERDRHLSSPYASRREEFRKPLPPPSPRGGGRGRISSRGSRGIRRERGGLARRRLADRSYVIKKRGLIRSGEFSRRPKLIRMRSSLGRRRRAALSSEKESSGDEEKKEKETTEEAEAEGTEPKPDGAENGGEGPKEEKEGAEGEEKPKEKKEKKSSGDEEKKKSAKIFIKLVCPQCNIKVATFRRYEAHLQGKTHLFAMRKVAAKQRSILAQMRQAQRNAQNELEKSGEGITDHTVFCPLCKLNYKQERAVHQATSAHKNMKKFLMPTCKVCKQSFKSPMVYEHHLCTVEHIKRKQRQESAGDGAGEEDNLDEFTTIDSVGEVGDENTGSAEEEQEKEEKKKKVSVGIEQIKRIEAYYCDLCRMFLPRGTENEYPDILAGHCRKRFHMQRYIRHKENEALKKRAEKLQRKETAEKEKKDDGDKEGEDASEEVKVETKEEEESKGLDNSQSADDDKLWDAVDKDLGELLEETDGRDDEDDEERVNGERYDRFRSADGEGKGGEASENAEEGKKAEEPKK